MKRQLIILLLSAVLLCMTACSTGTGHGTVISQSKTVDDVLREQAQAQSQQQLPAESPTAAADTFTTEAPAVTPDPVPTATFAPVPAPTVNGTPDPSRLSSDDEIDVDVTKLRPSVIYTRVSQLATMPEYFIGQTVRLQGNAGVFPGDSHVYYTCLVSDLMACCQTGIEFSLQDGYAYPEAGQAITVTGVYETYEENGQTYPRLRDAVIIYG